MRTSPHLTVFLSFILILSLLASLCACGQTSDSEISDNGDLIVDATATPDDDSSNKSAKKAQKKKTIDPQDQTATPEPSLPLAVSKTIVLDPGHASVRTTDQEPVGPGSSEMKNASVIGTCGVSTGKYEYELVMEFSQKLRTELANRGYTVILTRDNSDRALSNIERANIANSANADVFIRIHADAAESSADTGATAICITPGNPFVPQYYAQSYQLSNCLLTEYCLETGMVNGGIHERDDMTGNNWSNMPSCLFELGYMTNPEDDRNLCDPAFQERMVRGIANGLDRYFRTY